MKCKRLLLIIFLLIILLVFTSCSKDEITIIAKDIGEYYEGIDPQRIYLQNFTMDAKIVEEDGKAYLRFELNISKGIFLEGTKIVFRYLKGFKQYTIEGNKKIFEVGCYSYADIELDDSEYFITSVGYYIDYPYDGEYMYQNMYVPSKNDTSKFAYTTEPVTEFKKSIKWNLNKIKLNDNIYYIIYVDSLTNKNFDNRYKFELYLDGIYYPEIKYTNDNKRMYIILEPNKNYYRINLRFEYTCVDLLDSIDLTNDYPYED